MFIAFVSDKDIQAKCAFTFSVLAKEIKKSLYSFANTDNERLFNIRKHMPVKHISVKPRHRQHPRQQQLHYQQQLGQQQELRQQQKQPRQQQPEVITIEDETEPIFV